MRPSPSPAQCPAYGESPRRIAVIGSGAAGLAAAWALSGHHDVHLFEADDRLGGHAHTVDLDLEGARIAVDIGFIVFNDVNYPLLSAAFEALGVETQPSDMSFSVSTRGGRFEYSGCWPGGLFARRRNLLSPFYWSMLLDIRRFYGRAVADLDAVERERVSLGDYLAACRLSRPFRERHLLPMVGAIWSVPTGTAEDMPAATVIRFFQAHGLLRLRSRPRWRTVTGGSRAYVERIVRDMGATVYRGHPVKAVLREARGVMVAVAGLDPLQFDQAVVATHADQALRLLHAPSADEARILGAFKYSSNRVVLHGDPRLMPRRRAAWASWNFIEWDRRQGVTYWMNRLQGLPIEKPVLATLNPPMEPFPGLTYGAFHCDHPILDRDAIAAQARLKMLQGRNRTWFCGSYFGYGFHEDAFASGIEAATGLSASLAPHGRELAAE